MPVYTETELFYKRAFQMVEMALESGKYSIVPEEAINLEAEYQLGKSIFRQGYYEIDSHPEGGYIVTFFDSRNRELKVKSRVLPYALPRLMEGTMEEFINHAELFTVVW